MAAKQADLVDGGVMQLSFTMASLGSPAKFRVWLAENLSIRARKWIYACPFEEKRKILLVELSSNGMKQRSISTRWYLLDGGRGDLTALFIPKSRLGAFVGTIMKEFSSRSPKNMGDLCEYRALFIPVGSEMIVRNILKQCFCRHN